jgi:hypothetical protein
MDKKKILLSKYNGYWFATHPKYKWLQGVGESIEEAKKDLVDKEHQLKN